MSRKSFLENFCYCSAWTPGLFVVGTTYSPARKFYHYGGAETIVIQTFAPLGNPTLVLTYQYSPDQVAWTDLIVSDPWVAQDVEFYGARIHRDRLPAAVAQDTGVGGDELRGSYTRWKMEMSGGAFVGQQAFIFSERLNQMPVIGQSEDPIRGVPTHFNPSGTGLLQQDANGVDRIRFDYS